MSKQFTLTAALAMTILPFAQSTAQARHIDVYTRPSVVVPATPQVTVVHPAYPVHMYHHHYWRHLPHYHIHVHH